MKKTFMLLAGLCCTFFVHAQNVDMFTGSFSYNTPVLHVPSNKGTGVSIDINYSAGIQMSQSASEIGLGWGLSAGGAIYRSVVGYPDDTKNYFVPGNNGYSDVYAQGALYPKPGGNNNTDFDFDRTQKGLDSSEFMFPGYDNYSVGGPGFSGRMKLSYLKFYSYSNQTTSHAGEYKFRPDTTHITANSFPGAGNAHYRKPQFQFLNDFSDTLTSRHYPNQINNSTPFMDPTDNVTGQGYPLGTANEFDPYIGKHQSGTSILNQNFDVASGRLASTNLVEYFTNAEINAGTIAGFIDFQSSHTRSAAFPSEGIGYFRVTASNGLTYHYSLPVYTSENTTFTSPLDNDYALAVNSTTINYNGGPIDYHPLNSAVQIKCTTTNRYATQWLLTAVTGPDYVDLNANKMVDTGDPGYWVSYDYQQWSSNFGQRSPRYGYENFYTPDGQTQSLPLYFPFAPNNTAYKLSGLSGIVNFSRSEIYYLSHIRTTSHTAIFVRGIRNDEKSDHATVRAEPAFKSAPSLLLKRIILFRNEDLNPSIVKTAFTAANYPQFDFTNAASVINNTATFYTEDWYQQTHASWDLKVLKHVEFDQDYSLCRKYQGNVNVTANYSSVLSSQTNVNTGIAVSSYATSGKLTLKRILGYGFQNVKIAPSLKFEYDENPDYDPKKADYWGFYKSDATTNAYSRYTTNVSGNNAMSWSLNKITDALGGVTEILYESNSYEKVIDNESTNGVRGAAFIYRIKNMAYAGSNNNNCLPATVTMEEGSSSTGELNDFVNFSNSVVAGIKKKICIPYFSAYTINGYLSTLSTHPNQIYQGFSFGDCAYTMNGPSGNSNALNVTGINGGAQQVVGRKYNNGSGLHLYQYSAVSTNVQNDITYSGNGFLMIEMPVGYAVYGGGIRVKLLRTKNASNEVYIKQYTYEGGVATNEMDRFNYPVLKRGCAGSELRYTFLQPKSFDLFNLPPSIGYSKVSVQDMGQSNIYNGKQETIFITDPSAENNQFKENYAIQTVVNNVHGSITNLYTINECVNKFTNIFGAVKESKLFDKNDNILSKTVNEYEPTQQGASVENFHFEDEYYMPNAYQYPTYAKTYTVNILRNIPYVLKSLTTYGMGTFEKNESITRDELTGETTAFRVTGKNSSSSISYKIPAYKYYQSFPALAALSFTSPLYRTLLPLENDMYTYGNVDSTLTNTAGSGYSSSFLSAHRNSYSNVVNTRQSDTMVGKVTTASATKSHFFTNRTFAFNGGVNSMDDFGLLKKSLLNTNPLNLSTINNSLFWEPSSTYNWKLLNEVTLLDQYDHTVEMRDANNRFSASRFGYKGYYKSATAGNCNYASFTFADFESVPRYFGTSGATIDGDMLITTSNTLVDNSGGSPVPHTGLRSVKVTADHPVTFSSSSQSTASNTLEIGLQSGRIYRASVWVHSTNLSNARMAITIDGVKPGNVAFSAAPIANSASNLITTINNWNLLQIDFEVPEGFSTGSTGEFKIELKTTSGQVFFDDFILHPVESSFSASVYDARNGRVVSNIDENGLATTYTYNAEGQMLEVWKEIPAVGYKKVKQYTYNYARGAND